MGAGVFYSSNTESNKENKSAQCNNHLVKAMADHLADTLVLVFTLAELEPKPPLPTSTPVVPRGFGPSSPRGRNLWNPGWPSVWAKKSPQPPELVHFWLFHWNYIFMALVGRRKEGNRQLGLLIYHNQRPIHTPALISFRTFMQWGVSKKYVTQTIKQWLKKKLQWADPQ